MKILAMPTPDTLYLYINDNMCHNTSSELPHCSGGSGERNTAIFPKLSLYYNGKSIDNSWISINWAPINQEKSKIH